MEINAGDTAWVLVATALVMLMTPAVGFFYGGLVRQKNVLATIMHSFVILTLVSVQWVTIGYSLAFGPDMGGFIGGLDWVGLRHVDQAPNPDYAPGVPHLAFVAFQLMFAAITPALITGAFAERKRFKALVLFTLLWSTFVYAPVAHWVWGIDGWLRERGALDFAGGTVVHLTAGVTALVAAGMLGRRRGFGQESMDPHNLTMTVLGASLLWFGWFGFNAGSALSAGGLAANAFLATNTAAAMGALTWMCVGWIRYGQPSVLGSVAGAVAGMVAITPAAGYVDTMAGLAIGFGAGLLSFLGVDLLKTFIQVDDSLDVFAVHGLGGIWGALATGLFAQLAVNPAGDDGAFFGNPGQVLDQAIAIGAVILYTAVVSWVILKVIDLTVGLRVAEHEEQAGLDVSEHGEFGYQM